MTYQIKDYREGVERIGEWYDRHPDGRIVCDIVERPGPECDRWTVRAEVYRTPNPDEPPAGVGHSFLSVPGKTNFTRDSELENAETSAAGRALVMAGIPAKSIASDDEFATKKPARNPSPQTGATHAQHAAPSHDQTPSRPPVGLNRLPCRGRANTRTSRCPSPTASRFSRG